VTLDFPRWVPDPEYAYIIERRADADSYRNGNVNHWLQYTAQHAFDPFHKSFFQYVEPPLDGVEPFDNFEEPWRFRQPFAGLAVDVSQSSFFFSKVLSRRSRSATLARS
jgi:hypothetical protein